MSRRVPLLLLCLCLILAAQAIALATEFADVPTTYWAWSYIQGACNAGIVGGYPDGTYLPSLAVTRAQMAVFVARALAEGNANVPSGPPTATFTDVPTGYWAFKYVEYCVDQGVVQGYWDGYHPEEPVNRAQMAVYIARAMAGGDAFVPPGPETASFPDVPTGYWAFKYVEYCKAQNVVGGYWDGYHPDETVTRDQMAVYVCRAFDLPTPPPNYDAGEYFPLAEGTAWVYQREDGLAHIAEISGTADIGDQTYACLIDDNSTNYWRLDGDGLYLGGMLEDGGATNVTADPPFEIPRIVAMGSSGTTDSTVSVNGTPAGPGSFTYTLLGTETVTVPAGTFGGCLKFDIQISLPGPMIRENYVWLARNVGIVKQDGRDFGSDEYWELIAADVNGMQYPLQPYHITDYWPTGQGDTWNYEDDGHTASSVTVSGTITLGGQVYSVFSSSYGEAEFYRTAAAGLYLGGADTADGLMVATPPFIFPNDLQPCETRAQTSSVTADGVPVGNMDFSVTFAGVETMTVPAGTFENCLRLDIVMAPPGDSGEAYSVWIAKGVGKVKEFYPVGSYTRELVSATVGGGDYP
jgi:hypothetical protein